MERTRNPQWYVPYPLKRLRLNADFELHIAFSTAVALAEFENDRDDKKRVIFHARHLEQVVKMSRAFQDYLKSTHGMSQAEQARRYRIRNDFWNGLEEKGAS